jgi:hypothetical protein
VGDQVVVEVEAASFWSGKVTNVKGSEVTYEYGSNRSKRKATRDTVYVLAPRHVTVARSGDYAVCRTGHASWSPCTIKDVIGAMYTAEDQWGKVHNLGASDIIAPREPTRDNVKAKLEGQANDRVFLDAARAAGAPQRPEGWTPQPGDDVVALFEGSSWYGGRVRRVTPNKVQVAWDDNSKPSDRDYDEVAPKPETPQQVSVGQYVVARPRSGSLWDYYRVDSVEGDKVVLVDKNAAKRSVKTRDVLPLRR